MNGNHAMPEAERTELSNAVSQEVHGPLVRMRAALRSHGARCAAKKAERAFYRELVGSGLPKIEARYLAEEYGSVTGGPDGPTGPALGRP